MCHHLVSIHRWASSDLCHNVCLRTVAVVDSCLHLASLVLFLQVVPSKWSCLPKLYGHIFCYITVSISLLLLFVYLLFICYGYSCDCQLSMRQGLCKKTGQNKLDLRLGCSDNHFTVDQ